MPLSKKLLIGAIVLIALVAIVAFVAFSQPVAGQYDDFAKCLSEKGVNMYGAFWCSHCKAQKEAFGSSWRYVNYVECSTPDSSSQTQICSAAGIEGYPTWVNANGQRISGEASFAQLAQFSGCELK